MNMKMKRFISFAAAVCLALGFAGCANKEKEEPVKQVELNAPGEFPIAKEKTKITIGVQQNASIKDWETNALTRELEEKANVDLEFVVSWYILMTTEIQSFTMSVPQHITKRILPSKLD